MRKMIIGLLSMLATACLAIGLVGCEKAVGIKNIYLNDNKELIVELTDGTIKNLGVITENTPSNYSEGLSYTISEDGMYYSVSGIGLCSDRDVVIPAAYRGLPVKEIAAYAFKEETLINSVTIPSSITCIGEDAFYKCESLTSVYITDIAEWCKISGLSNLLHYGVNYKNFYFNNELVTDLIIPDGVTSISESAFYKCSSLTSVIIPDSVTSIDVWAFCYCSSLTSIEFKGTVAQWNEISKGSWHTLVPATEVVCSDGTAQL